MIGLHSQGQLFRKYVVVLVSLVGGVLVASGLIELYLAYKETRRAVVSLEREKASAAAQRIEQFVNEIERHVLGTSHSVTGALIDSTQAAGLAAFLTEQRELDFLQLLRNLPVVTELRHLDANGKEQLLVSRFALDAVGSGADFSANPAFLRAKSGSTYYSPVYFRNDSEPYMVVGVASGGTSVEVTLAEVSLRAVWDVVSQIAIGQRGYAYVVDTGGHLIAHPDVSLVLQKRNLSALPHVQAARQSAPGSPHNEPYATVGAGLGAQQSLITHAAIPKLGWFVFVEQPLGEAFAPLRLATFWGVMILVMGLVLSVLASVVLARRMVAPIRTLQEGAAKIGTGDLGHRIQIRTGDELEALSAEFNRTASQLQEMYSTLEQRVQERTRDLAAANEELRALSEVGRAVTSTLDLDTVLQRIASAAVQLTGADQGTMYDYDEVAKHFVPRVTHGTDEQHLALLRSAPLRLGEGAMGRAAQSGRPWEIYDVLADPDYEDRLRDFATLSGFRAVLAVPMMLESRIMGGLVMRRKTPGAFGPARVRLLETFSAQSALALENARLFAEIESKSRELAAASQHKSQFLSNMSHELRTPLNAILGFNEMILDGLCGEVPESFKDPLQEMQKSGKHLLRLINNVLDLAKIEAGRMELALSDYSVHDAVESVRSTLRPLADAKGLEFHTEVSPEIPLGYGDAGRIVQCLMNLAGNAVKFTKQGTVKISVNEEDRFLRYRIADTGVGIPKEKIGGLFTEFKQTDATIASEYGGTGLGLSITKKFVEMHGGTIWVESEFGKGSAFILKIPTRVGR